MHYISAPPIECLQCYICNSSVSPGCLDSEFKSHVLSTNLQPSFCNARDAMYCIKTTTIYGAIMGTTRFCSGKDLGNQCQYVDFPDHDRIYRACVFTCEGDACNQSQTSSPSAPVFLILILVFVFQNLEDIIY
ncbi:unnamed protein product [Mesocestoides corti]|uniref:Protein sleepless n=1 Tax=Mesocestoides corti TaxID=53468 RepID=A0A0R3UQT7_MESCO|nr:unnamed protein product [Mesocestoides corti]